MPLSRDSPMDTFCHSCLIFLLHKSVSALKVSKCRIILVGIDDCCLDQFPCWFHFIVKINLNLVLLKHIDVIFGIIWHEKQQNWVIDKIWNLLMNEFKFIKKGLTDLNVKTDFLFFLGCLLLKWCGYSNPHPFWLHVPIQIILKIKKKLSPILAYERPILIWL